jgi:sugar phosphate isomerase/epimerase
MEFGISTRFFGQDPLTLDLLERLRKAGYSLIELSCVRPHLDFHNRKLLRSIGRWFRENELPPPSIHLPYMERVGPAETRWISPLASDRRDREIAIDEIKRCLELTEYIHPSHLVMHLGIPGQPFTPAVFDYTYAALMEIEKFCGFRPLLENIPNDISTLDRIREFGRASQLPGVGICYDIGHQRPTDITGKFEDIPAIQINDNRSNDEHLWPFEGTRNWPAFIDQLVTAEYAGSIVFEVSGNDDLSKGAEASSRLTDLWEDARNSIDEFRLRHKLMVSAKEHQS